MLREFLSICVRMFAKGDRIPYIAALGMAIVVKYRVSRHVGEAGPSEEGPLLAGEDDAPVPES